ncbi:hypothetical protein DFH09DRAFT_1500174, partial [Mycena vulgaris]
MVAPLAYPLLPFFSFLCLLAHAVLLPRRDPLHNIPRLSRTFCAALPCLNQFINAVAAHDSFADKIPHWCNPLSINITRGTPFALSLQLLWFAVIQRHSNNPPRANILIDLAWCVVGPLLFYVVRTMLYVQYKLWRLLRTSSAMSADNRRAAILHLITLTELPIVGFLGVVSLVAGRTGQLGPAADRMGFPTEQLVESFSLLVKLVAEQVAYLLIAIVVCIENAVDGTMPWAWDNLHSNRSSLADYKARAVSMLSPREGSASDTRLEEEYGSI